ncbi:12964_t:CDS:2 [Dentiscutata erythropus]|uniref:12964_t:CDS:1 n=1 Tax=Dentiscutata erythropus TaxID=1348616 RepID=A0A9N9DVZ3_9GLOM|nr:12964_t:CDS:2 [Dentiscutata erythropus]
MVKQEILSILILLLFSTSCSVAIFDLPSLEMIPTVVGNYEFPKGIKIAKNITPPAGHVFKFYLIVSGYSWHRCVNKTWIFEESRGLFFNNDEDIHYYPLSTSASTFKNDAVSGGEISLGVKSIIPEYLTTKNSVKGAFEDVTYIVRPKIKGGNAPTIPCGNEQYPEGFIHSRPFILSYILTAIFHYQKYMTS